MKILLIFAIVWCIFLPLSWGEELDDLVTHRATEAVLHSVILGKNSLIFAVTGHGCTLKSDFVLRVVELQPVKLVVQRTRPDRCRARARQHKFGLTYDALPEKIRDHLYSGETIYLANPLAYTHGAAYGNPD